ncbi:MAG: oligosaccharide flippase family protein [Solirubrobacteraceae bacterium]|nr:oligosaccharide flippase family protein [Solirubrobacteraceae bacterium]
MRPGIRVLRPTTQIPVISDLSRRKVLSTGGSLLVAQIATALSGIVTARALGPEGKGVVAGVMAWPQLSAWVLLLGLGTATSLRVAETRDGSVSEALGNTVVYCLTVGVLGTVVGYAVLPGALEHLGPDARATAHLALLAIPISMFTEVLAGICLGLGRVRRYNTARVVGGLTVLVASLALVIADSATPQTVVLATMSGGLVGATIAAGGLPWRRIGVSLAKLRRDLAYGLRVFLTSMLNLINVRLDILLMTAFVSGSEIGYYTIANNAMLPITVVGTTMATLIMPAIGRARADRAGEASEDGSLIRRTAARYGLLMLIVAAVVAAAAPFALPFVFGQAFEPAVVLVWILLPGFVLRGYAHIVDAGLIGMRRPWVGNLAQGAGVLITAAMLPFLLPKYGAQGAAITSTCAYSASAVISLWALGRVQRIASKQTISTPLAPIGTPELDSTEIADVRDVQPDPGTRS